MNKKIIASLLLGMLALGFASIVYAYGSGACSKCYCSGFHAKKYGYPNMCNCGHWESEHSR